MAHTRWPASTPDGDAPRRRTALTVVAAVIERDGRILIGQRRPRDRHPLKWEFPGGKVEAKESAEAALARELEEELDIAARIGPEISRFRYQYGSRSPIQLIFFEVREFTREPRNVIYEQIAWVEPQRLPDFDFLDGDRDFVWRLASRPPS